MHVCSEYILAVFHTSKHEQTEEEYSEAYHKTYNSVITTLSSHTHAHCEPSVKCCYHKLSGLNYA